MPKGNRLYIIATDQDEVGFEMVGDVRRARRRGEAPVWRHLAKCGVIHKV